jgi:hypothetical protein
MRCKNLQHLGYMEMTNPSRILMDHEQNGNILTNLKDQNVVA